MLSNEIILERNMWGDHKNAVIERKARKMVEKASQKVGKKWKQLLTKYQDSNDVLDEDKLFRAFLSKMFKTGVDYKGGDKETYIIDLVTKAVHQKMGIGTFDPSKKSAEEKPETAAPTDPAAPTSDPPLTDFEKGIKSETIFKYNGEIYQWMGQQWAKKTKRGKWQSGPRNDVVTPMYQASIS